MLRLMDPRRLLLPVMLSTAFWALLPEANGTSKLSLSATPFSAAIDPLQAAQDLTDVTALRWVPRLGRLYVTTASAEAWSVFDHRLNLHSQLAKEPDWNSLPSPEGCQANGKNTALEVAGPGGRTIRWQVDSGELLLCVASWEEEGEIQWGPGWAMVEFRCSHSLGPWLEWRDADGVQHLSRIEADVQNPLIQRAHLRGLATSGEIQIRHRPVENCFPNRTWSDWIDLTIPKVEVSGARPTSMLHSTICGLRRVDSSR
jgi:hypothetical protein